jgi:hypothetical protein
VDFTFASFSELLKVADMLGGQSFRVNPRILVRTELQLFRGKVTFPPVNTKFLTPPIFSVHYSGLLIPPRPSGDIS